MVIDIIFGFLGAGKTTFIKRLIEHLAPREKLAVLVNEFGEVGIDGQLLSGLGGEVVEMASGCICCTIQSDFRSQVVEIHDTFHPARLVVEPTGVATIGQIRHIFTSELFEPRVSRINYILVADAAGFLNLYAANRHFVESQVSNSDLILLNKCDLVTPKRAGLIEASLVSLSPASPILKTEFGRLDWREYHGLLAARAQADQHALGAEHEDEPEHDHAPGPEHHHEEDALGYSSFGQRFPGLEFLPPALESFFQDLAAGSLGEVVRAKGIFRTGEDWLLWELASGNLSHETVAPQAESLVSIIGRDLDTSRLKDQIFRAVKGALL
ncbi:MAG: GTP-binding protein [Deltaproteobacteria bacterium]|nr:GTP-binding protein [Deltaproteobacteria bacterium]